MGRGAEVLSNKIKDMHTKAAHERKVRSRFQESASQEGTDTWLAVHYGTQRGLVEKNPQAFVSEIATMFATLYPASGKEVSLDALQIEPGSRTDQVAQVLFDARLAHSPLRAAEARKRLSREF